MIVLIVVATTIVTVTVIAIVCSSDNSNSTSSNFARSICRKIVSIGSVNSLDDIHHVTVIT